MQAHNALFSDRIQTHTGELGIQSLVRIELSPQSAALLLSRFLMASDLFPKPWNGPSSAYILLYVPVQSGQVPMTFTSAINGRQGSLKTNRGPNALATLARTESGIIDSYALR